MQLTHWLVLAGVLLLGGSLGLALARKQQGAAPAAPPDDQPTLD